ncbi:hypothetical protein PQR11_15710 [Paraburkholderia strydomiana]|uniref:hypothetical protein n=1 Tax=Paraburkholderia strydomiana TaxID=1245417 RepID=UPI0038BDE200
MEIWETPPLLPLPFRKSIWTPTNGYQFGDCTRREFGWVSRIYDVFRAKLNIAFPSLSSCLALADAVAALPNDPEAVAPIVLEASIGAFIRATRQLPSVNIATAICTLAVFKDGRYAPIDRKVVTGLFNLGVVDAAQADALLSQNVAAFSRVYVCQVLPEWHRETQRRSPPQADGFWASNG